MDHFCYLCLVFVMLSRLFIAAFRTPAVSCDVYLCFVTFLCGILGRVWYLIVSIPDLYRLSYFKSGRPIVAWPAYMYLAFASNTIIISRDKVPM